MNACQETQTVPTIKRGRIVLWEVICPTCGTLATGRHLKDVDAIYRQHVEENQTTDVAPRTLGTIRLPM